MFFIRAQILKHAQWNITITFYSCIELNHNIIVNLYHSLQKSETIELNKKNDKFDKFEKFCFKFNKQESHDWYKKNENEIAKMKKTKLCKETNHNIIKKIK